MGVSPNSTHDACACSDSNFRKTDLDEMTLVNHTGFSEPNPHLLGPLQICTIPRAAVVEGHGGLDIELVTDGGLIRRRTRNILANASSAPAIRPMIVHVLLVLGCRVEILRTLCEVEQANKSQRSPARVVD